MPLCETKLLRNIDFETDVLLPLASSVIFHFVFLEYCSPNRIHFMGHGKYAFLSPIVPRELFQAMPSLSHRNF